MLKKMLGEAGTEKARGFWRFGAAMVLLAGLISFGIPMLTAQENLQKALQGKGVVPRPTSNELTARRTKVRTDGKIKKAEKPLELSKLRSGKATGLVTRSAVLSYGKHWTFVPKEAILHIPRHLTDRVHAEKKGTLLPWNEFYEKNRGWLQLQKVTISQARGEADLSETQVKSYSRSGRVVVAICHNAPISVKPRKKPDPGTGGPSR